MTVYVDNVRHPFGRMIMCHMWSVSIDELLTMADRIGVGRHWIQGHPTLSLPRFRKASWVHFDIALSKKAQAIALGAVLTDMFGPLEHCARLQGDVAKLKQIAQFRARRGLPPDGILPYREQCHLI